MVVSLFLYEASAGGVMFNVAAMSLSLLVEMTCFSLVMICLNVCIVHSIRGFDEVVKMFQIVRFIGTIFWCKKATK